MLHIIPGPHDVFIRFPALASMESLRLIVTKAMTKNPFWPTLPARTQVQGHDGSKPGTTLQQSLFAVRIKVAKSVYLVSGDNTSTYDKCG
jgi:hypothetical protein